MPGDAAIARAADAGLRVLDDVVTELELPQEDEDRAAVLPALFEDDERMHLM